MLLQLLSVQLSCCCSIMVVIPWPCQCSPSCCSSCHWRMWKGSSRIPWSRPRPCSHTAWKEMEQCTLRRVGRQSHNFFLVIFCWLFAWLVSSSNGSARAWNDTCFMLPPAPPLPHPVKSLKGRWRRGGRPAWLINANVIGSERPRLHFAASYISIWNDGDNEEQPCSTRLLSLCTLREEEEAKEETHVSSARLAATR